MSLGRVKGAWTKCLLQGKYVKRINQMGKICFGILWIRKRLMNLLYDQSAMHMSDVKSEWSRRKIVESGAEFLT